MSGWLKKRRVLHRYDLTAEMYDMRYAQEQEDKIEAAMRNIKTEQLGLVLDAGCGTGILFSHVAQKAGTLVGLDISKKTLLQAKRRAVNGKINVHLVQADMDNMPFRDNIYNHVFALTVLQNTPNKNKTLMEIKRVGEKDAVFVITGLRKIFDKPTFKGILTRANMKVEAMIENNLKCYVAVCTNSHGPVSRIPHRI
jgi:ubiquinone/menaquinone biosynthesis C-methylase UbiE